MLKPQVKADARNLTKRQIELLHALRALGQMDPDRAAQIVGYDAPQKALERLRKRRLARRVGDHYEPEIIGEALMPGVMTAPAEKPERPASTPTTETSSRQLNLELF